MEMIKANIKGIGTVEFIAKYGIYKGELSEIELSSVIVNGKETELNPELTYKLSLYAEKMFYEQFAEKYEYAYGLAEG